MKKKIICATFLKQEKHDIAFFISVFPRYILWTKGMEACLVYCIVSISTAWKLSVFRVILARIFPHSDWIRRDTEYLSVFSPNAGKKADQNNSEYGQFSCSVHLTSYLCFYLKIITLSLWFIDSYQQKALLKLDSSNQELS